MIDRQQQRCLYRGVVLGQDFLQPAHIPAGFFQVVGDDLPVRDNRYGKILLLYGNTGLFGGDGTFLRKGENGEIAPGFQNGILNHRWI